MRKYFLNALRKRMVFFAIVSLGFVSASYAGEKNSQNIKLGVIGPMKFPAGEGILQGATLAVDEINNSGGVRVGTARYNLEIMKSDDNCLRSVGDAANAMMRLMTVDKVNFVVGGYHSESVLAQQEIMASHKIIFIDTGSVSPKVPGRLAKEYEKFKYYFRLQSNAFQEAKRTLAQISMVAKSLERELGIKNPKVALLVEKLLWVKPLMDLYQDQLPKMGMEIVGIWRPSTFANDLTAEWTAVKDSSAHIAIEVVSGPVGVALPRQWNELQIPCALVGTNINGMGGSHWEDTDKKCNYEFIGAPIGPVDITPKTMGFYRTFEKKYGTYPIYCAATTYDSVFVLKEAIERAGTLDTDRGIKELEKTDYTGVVGSIVFEPPGQSFPHMAKTGPHYIPTVGFQWIDGKQVVVWPDGNALLGDEGYVGLKPKGIEDYRLPPWMLTYWKAKQQ